MPHHGGGTPGRLPMLLPAMVALACLAWAGGAAGGPGAPSGPLLHQGVDNASRWGADWGEDGSGYRDYDGYGLVTARPQTKDQLEGLRALQRRELNGVQFWKEPNALDSSVDLLVPPETLGEVTSLMHDLDLTYHVRANHVKRSLSEHRRTIRSTNADNLSPARFNLTVYHTYDEITDWLDFLDSTCDNCQLFKIGKSYEGRDIKVIKIGRGNKPAFWIDAGFHAREWISHSTVLHIISKLLDPTDRVGRYLTSRFVFYILPVVNPDGYVHTWTADRLWRKTRSRHADPNVRCRGVDPNRNFDFHWGGEGSSKNPCSESYGGPGAFSEAETRAMADFVQSVGEDLAAYVSLHAYGQYVLTPWGYTTELPADYNQLFSVAKTTADAIRRVYNKKYTYGSAARMLYPAAGGSDDWAKGVVGVQYSFTVELRDGGDRGFVLPPSEIVPTAEEMFAGVRALAGAVLRSRRRRHRIW